MSAHDSAKDRQERFDHGMAVLSSIDGESGRKVIDSLADISPELGHQVVACAFGKMYDRPQLAPRDRQLVTLGMLTPWAAASRSSASTSTQPSTSA